jgi:indolepyruvate ferredoxin oxidoreductase alpha subunit
MKRILSGNEAIAQGAWEAGVKVASAYPGTPSTEILENFAPMPNVYAEWAPNEKVALDTAIGAAYAGRRALSTMKHVGVNVAADALFYVAMTGIEAGLVLVSADDPSMHSSQNEQDNRQFARFTRIPCLDPADSQEAKDMTIAAFELSEQFDTPVMLRLTTRICHTSGPVEVFPDQREHPPIPESYPRNPDKYVMIPAHARLHHKLIEERIEKLTRYAETSPLNVVEMRSTEIGIVTGGIAYQYVREVFPDASVLKLGMVYPIPQQLVRNFANDVKKLIVIEELDPFIEEQIRLMGIEIYTSDNAPRPYRMGSKTIFPVCGEFNSSIVRKSAEAAGLLKASSGDIPDPASLELPNRPPVLCPGCPHRATFYNLKKMKFPVAGDIGCYTLGVVAPLSAIHTCGCMGAGIGVPHGAAVAGDTEKHVAVIGDSTFFHTGIPALMNVVYNQSNVITIIMDNRITGMTGHQQNPGTGKTLQMKNTVEVDIEAMVRAMGIEHVKTVNAFSVKEISDTLKEWKPLAVPAVLITKGECALLPTARKQWMPIRIDSSKCIGCDICIRTGCPALRKSDQTHEKNGRCLTEIDPLQCTGCEVCAQVCPQDAILFREQILAEQANQEVNA